MSEAAVDASLSQSVTFAEKLIDLYGNTVAQGEVGPGGSGRASDEPILGDRREGVLLYGRVQSGKTAAMVLTAALCVDNGFRVIVVLTTDNVALVEQTARRFKAVDGPRVFSTIASDGYEWEGQEDELREDIATEGLILVCAKNDLHLSRVIAFLQSIDAPAYPTLVFDDEADAATPDTTIQARTSGRANAPEFPSTINRRVIENQKPGQEGESIGEIFPHQLYVQVTATPYIFFLQRGSSAIRPSETLLLEPGDGYCGGEVFFDSFDPNALTPPEPPLVLVGDNELRAISRRRVPPGLAASIDFFLLAAVAKALRSGWPAEGFNHLSHPSASIAEHTLVANHIEKHVGYVRRELRQDRPAALVRLATAYSELQRTVADVPALDELADELSDAIRQAEVIRINSVAAALRPGPRLNFLVGGNILGRGLTIDDLLVTYYVRQARTSQMDTVWQHARMYGYRRPLLGYTRVYLPRSVATIFKGIHDAEVALRELVSRDGAAADPVIMLPARARATRKNAVESEFPRVINAGIAQFAPRGVVTDPVVAASVRDRLVRLQVPLDETIRENRLTQIPLDEFLDMIGEVPIDESDSGKWTPEVAAAVVETYRTQFQERGSSGLVYVRELEGSEERERARLSGPEVTLIRRRADGLPALVLMWTGTAAQPNGWYPTLVMPADSKAYIFPPE
ncbi:Z1 domain-containing protein [Bradyrhizobium sp. USDA 4011]